MDKTSLFKLSGLPDSFGALLLGFCFILLLSPYFSGADFGLFKIPSLTPDTKKVLKILGPIIFLGCILSFVPILPTSKEMDVARGQATPSPIPSISMASATPAPTIIQPPTPIPSLTHATVPTSTATPTPVTTRDSTHPATQPKDEFTEIVNGVEFKLVEARLKGSILIFWFIAKNQGADKNLCLYYNSTLTDEDGTPHRVRAYAVGNKERSAAWTCNDLKLPFDVPTRFGLAFNTVPPTAKRIPYLKVVIQRGGDVELRDIPIPYKR